MNFKTMFCYMEQTGPRFNSVEKALKILLAFQAERPLWGVRELAAHLGFSPATVQRTLNILKVNDFVLQDSETRQYRLGRVYFRFLHTLQATYPFTRTAQEFMRPLLYRTRETVHLNVIENMERVCIDHMESPQNLKATMPVGSRSPIYAGASSKCLLAFSPQPYIDSVFKKIKFKAVTQNTIMDAKRLREELARIRQQGYAVSLAERNPGLGSISAPVLDYNGLLLASLSLAIPEIRFADDRYRQACVGELVRAAKAFSRAMGFKEPAKR